MDHSSSNTPTSQYPLAELLLQRFQGRQDAYLSQLDDGGYITVKEPVTSRLIEQHLGGEVTVGIFMLMGDKVSYSGIDFDIDENTSPASLMERVLIIKRLLNHHIIDSLLVDSGRKGYHLDIFFEQPIEARLARELLRRVLWQAERDRGLPMLQYEVFPKQDRADDGFGNTPKLACGTHRKSGRRCSILDNSFVPVKDEATALARVAPTPVELVLAALEELPELEPTVGPKESKERGWVSKALEGVPEGQRDTTCASLAGYFKNRQVPYDVTLKLLEGWGERCQPAFSENEVRKTVNSIYRYEAVGERMATPKLSEVVWRGLFADYRDLVSNTTEAPDSYHFGVFATVLGATLSRRIYVYYANPTYPNFYICTVGATGLARKGTAWRRGRHILRALHSTHEEEEAHFLIIPGIGSAEGLLDALNGQNKVIVVAEEEFRSLLTKARQEGLSNLIPKLTTLFDCPELETLQTRQRRVIAKEPFLSIITGTTTAWLEKSLSESDIYGGFANRFLYIVGEPKQPMAFPRPVDRGKETELIKKINGIRLWADGIKASDTKGEIAVSKEAKILFEDYYNENYEKSKGETLDGILLRRAPAYAWKFALLYAAIDMSPEITAEHLEPAIDVCRFFEDCVGRVFCNFGDSATAALEKKILHILREAGGALPRREIYTKMHISAMEIERVTTGMKKLGLIQEFSETKKRGPAAVFYRLV